jgi:predicted lipid-binding transport protein (Tim44 family)
MDGGFPYGDIIVIGAIAAFILLRYRAMLGEPRGRDEEGIRPTPTQTREFERVIQLPVTRTPEKKEGESDAYGALSETFTAMRGLDREFTVEDFLHGARTAYEMVLAAFTKRDHDTLKMLLSTDMYNSFALSLSDAAKENRFTDTTLVAISRASIKSAKLSGNQATLTVDFVSDQIHLIRDTNGTILEGDSSQQNTVEDEWVFTRNLTSSSPNWTIIET